ncbi:uncharacterized protein [Anoplolepis gracilipes]|uniref:uncharacterized protein n=1 Tax=Anoplolepis gracilipes TaxID=354296 RepID=UPI003B9EDCE1
MKSISLESFLFLFTLKLFVNNAYPIIDDNEEIVKDNIMKKSANIPINDADASVTLYTCVYIPPTLEACKFTSYDKTKDLQNLKHTLLDGKRRELSRNNKIFYAHSPRLSTDKSINTIIYEIQRCVPSRLPFILPQCTDEDFANKKSEIQQLYPFVIDDFSKGYEFPMFNFSTQTRIVSKSV